jgi:hypothetical protein
VAIIAGPDQQTENLTFRWYPPAAISGSIRDSNGETVERALVQLIRARVVAGRRILGTWGWQWTNDLGQYRFAPLPAGTYFLCVTGEPWYSARARPLTPTEKSLAYIPMYYTNSADAAHANPIELQTGDQSQADFVLNTAPGSAVVVKYDAKPGLKGMVSLITDGLGGTQSFQRQEPIRGGMQRIEGVPPGRYLLRVAGTVGTTDLSARQIVEVNGSDIEAELTLRPAPTVSGTVRLKNPSAKPRGSILVSLVNDTTGPSQSTAVQPEGSFSFPSVVVGSYRVAIRGTDGYFAFEIRPTSKTEMRDGVIDLMDGDSVTMIITASDEVGRIKGFAISGEQQVAGSIVILAPVGSTDKFLHRGFLTDSDGSFDLEHVPAGKYLLFATSDTGLEYTNPNALKPYLLEARLITVESHGVSVERVPIVTRKK